LYDRVEIDPTKGERCFDTEAEAISAGGMPAGNCPETHDRERGVRR
jgi:hypothetical protein